MSGLKCFWCMMVIIYCMLIMLPYIYWFWNKCWYILRKWGITFIRIHFIWLNCNCTLEHGKHLITTKYFHQNIFHRPGHGTNEDGIRSWTGWLLLSKLANSSPSKGSLFPSGPTFDNDCDLILEWRLEIVCLWSEKSVKIINQWETRIGFKWPITDLENDTKFIFVPCWHHNQDCHLLQPKKIIFPFGLSAINSDKWQCNVEWKR